jgi:hypothetical protein
MSSPLAVVQRDLDDLTVRGYDLQLLESRHRPAVELLTNCRGLPWLRDLGFRRVLLNLVPMSARIIAASFSRVRDRRSSASAPGSMTVRRPSGKPPGRPVLRVIRWLG